MPAELHGRGFKSRHGHSQMGPCSSVGRACENRFVEDLSLSLKFRIVGEKWRMPVELHPITVEAAGSNPATDPFTWSV